MSNKPDSPLVTVDIVILLRHESQRRCVLVKRKNEPHGWALPGGVIDPGESGIAAAIRETEEETGCRLANVRQFHTYTDPKRDPRGPAVSIVYTAETIDTPVANDDAAAIGYFDFTSMQAYSNVHNALEHKELCFDHPQILMDINHFYLTQERPTRE
jgi:8-oxo-dGTP diphosphatase